MNNFTEIFCFRKLNRIKNASHLFVSRQSWLSSCSCHIYTEQRLIIFLNKLKNNRNSTICYMQVHFVRHITWWCFVRGNECHQFPQWYKKKMVSRWGISCFSQQITSVCLQFLIILKLIANVKLMAKRLASY